jgi:hypothetical protein
MEAVDHRSIDGLGIAPNPLVVGSKQSRLYSVERSSTLLQKSYYCTGSGYAQCFGNCCCYQQPWAMPIKRWVETKYKNEVKDLMRMQAFDKDGNIEISSAHGQSIAATLCSIELLNDEPSVATEDDSSNAVRNKIKIRENVTKNIRIGAYIGNAGAHVCGVV